MPKKYATTLAWLAAGSGLLIGMLGLFDFWTNYVGHPVERFFASVWRILVIGISILILAGGGWLAGAVIGWLRSKTVSGPTPEMQNLSKTMRDLTEQKAKISQSLNQALEHDRIKPYPSASREK